MKKLMLDVLEKTYNNCILRRKTVPLFLSNPGIGKSQIIKEFAASKGVKMTKITLSQRMPNEVVGMLMPDVKSGKMVAFNSLELSNLKPGDIIFFDEVFNGTLKQTLDAVLNFLEDRVFPNGEPCPDVMIIAASNPQGLINLTPQIKERFIRYDLKFEPTEYQNYLEENYGMPLQISQHLCSLIRKETFEHDKWNYVTPRSLEKAINQVGCELESPYNEILLPYLNLEVELTDEVKSLNLKGGDKVPYLSILKAVVAAKNKVLNTTTNKKLELI